MKKNHVYTFDQVLDKLIALSTYKGKIKKVTDSQFIRPTDVPRLIGKTFEFRKLTKWKPTLSVDEMLLDTLDYWREFVKKDLY